MNQDVNVLALVKGKERYVFMYNEKNRNEVLETFARYAADSKLSFSWYDAAVLTQRVRNEQRKAEIAAARAANQRKEAEKRQEKPSRLSAYDQAVVNLLNSLDD